MDSKEVERLWEEAFEARRSKKFYRNLAVKHPIVKKWFKDEARRADPKENPLAFLYRPRWRNRTRMRRLRIINALLWALEDEGAHLKVDSNDRILVVMNGNSAHFWVVEETIGPVLPMSPDRAKYTGRLTCNVDAKPISRLKRQWEDEPGALLESQLPGIVSTFVAWDAVTAPARLRWDEEQRAAMIFLSTDKSARPSMEVAVSTPVEEGGSRMDADEIDLVDEPFRPFVRALGNLVITFALADAELLGMVAEMVGGDEHGAVALLKSSTAKDAALSLAASIGLSGFDLDELLSGIEGFWRDKDERNRLIHDRWFPNMYEGSVATRGITRTKVPQEIFGTPTVEEVWALASRFSGYDELFSHRAWALRKARENSGA